jgi:hypothetical protein
MHLEFIMRFRIIILTLVVGVVCATGTFAEVPNYINYQGTLTDTSGNTITGARSMQFSLYADSTGGTALWSEMQWTVEVNDGLFRTSLGSVTTLPSSLFDGNVLWLGIQVSPDPSELSPSFHSPVQLSIIRCGSCDVCRYGKLLYRCRFRR